MEETEVLSNQQTDSPPIPEGTEVIGEKLICSKHGDVTGSVTPFRFLKVEENENKEKFIQPYTNIFCTQCICDLLSDLQRDGKIGTITREKQVATHEQAAKIREYYAERLKKLQEQQSSTGEAKEEENVDEDTTK